MDFLVCKVLRAVGFESFDNIAGGETAGIPFSALIAERLSLPLTYVRKKQKGYGKNSRIEGLMRKNDRVLLVEDMTTDGGSKLSFLDAIRETGATCKDIAVIFYYDIFSEASAIFKKNNIKLHFLCTWWDILEEVKLQKTFTSSTIKEVEKFLNSPREWQNERL